MASLAGSLHRPLSAMAAVVVAAISSELPDKFSHPTASLPDPAVPENKVMSIPRSSGEGQSWVPQISVSNLSGLFSVSSIQSLLGDVSYRVPHSSLTHTPDVIFQKSCSSPSPPPAILSPYQYAKLHKLTVLPESKLSIPSSSSEVMYRWHLPHPNSYDGSGMSKCSAAKNQTVVVLLGWLGAKQKHLQRYAEWYTSRGFHAVTFTFPMSDVMSYRVGGKAEQNLELLATHLAGWAEEQGKNLVFHTFSNTGWLTYGVVLEKFWKQDRSLMQKIKGCIVDSAPVAAADPQVWASGFSAAFFKKQSVATKGSMRSTAVGLNMLVAADSQPKPAATETALLAVLEKLFEIILNLPSINRRLSDVLYVLSSEQPKCPQLYIYSSADRVIPVKSVETFIEAQRRAGHDVRACDFISSPHVDHFRSHPGLYTSQLTTFIEDCIITCCKDSS